MIKIAIIFVMLLSVSVLNVRANPIPDDCSNVPIGRLCLNSQECKTKVSCKHIPLSCDHDSHRCVLANIDRMKIKK
uniref:Uncharacterized protein n=1 Tax=Ciona intestinalis TaxID=7719 RepID=H2XZT4_CIOIN